MNVNGQHYVMSTWLQSEESSSTYQMEVCVGPIASLFVLVRKVPAPPGNETHNHFIDWAELPCLFHNTPSKLL